MATTRSGKIRASLDAALVACGLSDGATLSFHHHLRDGDSLVNQVLAATAARGLKDLRVSMSSIFPVHAPLVDHIRSGVISRIWTDYAKGPVADVISDGALPTEAVFQSHGGRARAIEAGELNIDAAFIAAPVAREDGSLTGAIGRAAFGPMGYPMVDAAHAKSVVAVVEEIQQGPLPRADINGTQVQHIVQLDCIGEPAGIVSGATRMAHDAVSLAIADQVALVIAASGLLRDGLSFQTGAGGVSLASADAIGRMMAARGYVGSFISGGICGTHVALVREGLFREIRDVQCFDTEAVASYAKDSWHHGMSAAEYASPLHPDPVVDRLDVVALGAAEIDRDFNINVITGGDGRIMGGPGGHPDTAAGAKLTIATTRLIGGGFPKVVEQVGCITTAGDHVDVLLTDAGIAVNPKQPELSRLLRDAKLPVIDMDRLIEMSRTQAKRQPRRGDGRVVARVEDRHGQTVGSVRQSAES